MKLLTGYYGERNAGDDAFTVICARMLVAAGETPIGVLAKRLPRLSLAGVTALVPEREWWGLADRWTHFRVQRWLDRGASLLVGGGSVFRTAPAMAELEALLARHPHAGHAAIGVSLGPYPTAADEAAVTRTLTRFHRLGLRDRASFERAQAQAPHAEVRLTFDLAPLLPIVCPGLENLAPRSGLGIALCGPSVSGAELEGLAQLLRDWAPGRVDRIVLVEFNGGTTASDRAAHERLASLLAGSIPVDVLRYGGDPTAVFRVIGSLRALVAMRLHAAVFGYCAGTATIVVPYQEKGDQWAEMIGQPVTQVTPLGQLSKSHFEAVWNTPVPPTLPVPEAIERARSNFELALR